MSPHTYPRSMILASFLFALFLSLGTGDTFAHDPASHLILTVDIPMSSGEFGFTALDDLNDHEDLAGNFVVGPEAFLLTADRHFSAISCPSESRFTAVKAINTQGTSTGFCLRNGSVVGVVRTRRGRVTILRFPQATFTEAIGINDDGQVVGDYRGPDGQFHGFFWDAGLFLTFDVPFPEAESTAPTAINNKGQIVGFYLDTLATPHGFLYSQGVFSRIDIPGADVTLLLDINDQGHIVAVANDPVLGVQSFVLAAGAFQPFAIPLPGAMFTDLSGINNRGHLVGRYLTRHPDQGVLLSHGFLAIPQPTGTGQADSSIAHSFSRTSSGAPLVLALDGCPGAVAPPGTIIPAKITPRWMLCDLQ